MTAMIKGADPAGDSAYDVERIRTDFPILFREVYGKPLVYLDNGASAQKPTAMLEAIEHAYKMEYANVHRGLHYLSNTATSKYEDARETVRRFLNAPSVDEIILSIMEHHSNIVPWHFHRERRGAVLKWAPITDEGEFQLDKFEQLFNQHTKMVAITHMSNVLGTITPLKEIVRIAHAHNVPVLVDGSQSAVHMTIDVQDLDVDFYVFTGHKTYGPSGIGVLYAKKQHLDAMPPYMGGGEMIESVHQDAINYGAPPHKFEAGTPLIVQAIGLGAAIDYVQSIGKARIRAHEGDVVKYAHGKLGEINSLRIIGTAKEKGAIVSFEMKNAHPHDIATVIDRSGVAVRAGTHCVMPLLARYGVTATCRASFGLYNTKAEVDTLAEALVKAQDMFA